MGRRVRDAMYEMRCMGRVRGRKVGGSWERDCQDISGNKFPGKEHPGSAISTLYLDYTVPYHTCMLYTTCTLAGSALSISKVPMDTLISAIAAYGRSCLCRKDKKKKKISS